MRLEAITPVFIDTVPPKPEMEHGVVYISEKYSVAIHLCACGCGIETVMPLNFEKDNGQMSTSGWGFSRSGESESIVTFTPSVGNMQLPCKSHYFIRSNKIEWC